MKVLYSVIWSVVGLVSLYAIKCEIEDRGENLTQGPSFPMETSAENLSYQATTFP